jgi:hypothetical protein
MIAVVSVLLACVAVASGGTWTETGNSTFTANANGWYNGWRPCMGPFVTCANTDNANVLPLRPGFKKRDLGRGVNAPCDANVFLCPLLGEGKAWTSINGLNSNTVTVQWLLFSQGYNNCECAVPPYADAGGDADLNAVLELRVQTTPPGKFVRIDLSWWALIVLWPDPEAGAEDTANLNNATLEVLGQNLLPARFRNINNVATIARPTGGRVIYARGGDVITIRVAGAVDAQIQPPPVERIFNEDLADASYQGALTMRITEPGDPPPPPLSPSEPVFSVDIGSDAEFSDNTQDGNEVFDPGDMYFWRGSLPPGGADGVVDDAQFFAVDYWPAAPDGPPAGTGAQTCIGLTPPDIPPILDDRFDLDGFDGINVRLSQVLSPMVPLPSPWDIQPSVCVPLAEHLVVSFDDDWSGHYAGGLCEIPVERSSPMGRTYGTSIGQDELWGVELDDDPNALPGAPPFTALLGYPVTDEEFLHANMWPNPDAGEGADDDVDAVDIGFALADCQVGQYISVDHEAVGQHAWLGALDPGVIYEVIPPPGWGLIPMFDAVANLGLLPGTDIDAFTFAAMKPCDGCPPALVLLFSVDDDDYLTYGVDESGGLDPAMIYASFLTGTSFPLLTRPLADDIDAISATGQPFGMPNCNLPPSVLLWADDFESYAAGSMISGQGGWVLQTSDPTRDAAVTPAVASSGLQSLEVEGRDWVSQPFSVPAPSRYTLLGRVYVPSGPTGRVDVYVQNTWAPGGPPAAWVSARVALDLTSGVAYDAVSSTPVPVPLIRDAWTAIRVDIDLVRNLVSVYYEGRLLDRRAWKPAGGQLTLAAVGLRSLNGFAYFDDLQLFGLDDCNLNGYDDACELALGSASDCNANGEIDACDIAAGISLDNNGNGIPDECETDCNGNGVPDADDIANGTSSDCDSNAVPDECDIAGGAPDCNGNGAPDICDITNGTSLDNNVNGVPDECEQPPPCPGDMNCDGYVDFSDIPRFIEAFNYPGGTGWPYPTCPWLRGDCDGDGDVDFSDINAFVARLGVICP